jgi:hypothetical protein
MRLCIGETARMGGAPVNAAHRFYSEHPLPELQKFAADAL